MNTPSPGPTQLFKSIENATGSVDLNMPQNIPTPNAIIASFQALGIAPRITTSITSSIKASFAPNPSGLNLALSAIGAASSFWPWALPTPEGTYIWYYPYKGNDGKTGYNNAWMSSFWGWNHWFSLTWAQPQIINRVYISNEAWFHNYFGQTIQGIQYFNLNFHSYVTIPNTYSSRFGGSGNPGFVDFTFPAVQTTGIIVLLNTGPTNPHPNATVMIEEIEVYGEATASLKIIQPPNNSQFGIGDTIEFRGEKTGTVANIEWLTNGVSFGTGLSINKNDLSPGTHTITLRGIAAGKTISDSIMIGIKEITKIKIKNLDSINGIDPFADSTLVSYRAAKTRFQAIGYFSDDTEVGPVSANWALEGGDVVATEQLRLGILAACGSLGAYTTRIGSINGFVTVASTSTVTFNSFLSGNITLKAIRNNASDSVAIRIKQPTFKVNVYPVEGVDVSEIFPIWKTLAEQVWNKENIMRIESIELQPVIPNVTYPNSPLVPPTQGSEEFILSNLSENPSYLNPLVYDFLLGQNSGFFVVPRQSSFLFTQRDLAPVNVYVVEEPLSYFEDQLVSPPKKRWRFPNVYAVSSRDYFWGLEKSGVVLREFPAPYSAQYQKFLAQGIGRIFGLPQYVNWLTNLMDFGPNGGLVITPLQYIAALNYNGDNPQSSFFISEQ